jgi:DNA-binding transcriptional regulator YiaG
MNDIQSLKQRISKDLPKARLALEAPHPPRPNAAWWLEIEHGGHEVVVEWKPGRGFGLTSPAEGFGEGADEACYDVDAAARRVLELLRNKERTTPPAEIALAKLRQSRRISQEALAAALNIRQAAVSKMERRADMRLSTLEKAIAAMGGKLEIRARFRDRIVLISHGASSSGPAGRAAERRRAGPMGENRR